MSLKALLTKYKNSPEAVRAGLWFTICFVFQRGIQFIGMPIYTRIMTQDDYGVYSTFLSWAHVIVIASSLNIYSGIFNKAMIKFEDRQDQYTSSVLSLTTITSVFIATIILVFKDSLAVLLKLDVRCIILLVFYVLSFPPAQYWTQRQKFHFRYHSIIAFTIVHTLLNLGMGIVFVVLSTYDKGIALVNAVVVAQVAISIAFFIHLFMKGRCIIHKQFWTWSLGLAIPLLPHFFSEVLLGHADRIMINSMCGSDKAAIYNIAYQISMVMTIIRTGVNSAFLPWEYKTIKAKDYRSLKSTTSIYAVMMCIMTILFMMVGPEILMIVAPSSYSEALIDIPAIMAGCFFIFLYVLFLNVEVYYEKKQYVAIASFVAAVLNVVLNHICISHWGYLAAGYTTAISYAIMIVLHYLFYRRIQRSNPELGSFYNTKLLAGLMLMTTAFSGIALFLYTNRIIRYSFICIVIVFIYSYRRKLQELLMLLKRK